ncbi:MAG: Ig-like domain-containing protein, partial [Prevotella sp.]|nr:Ig-like domain-containing protein [Prevotella sp.]
MKKCITSLFCTLVYGVAYALAPVSYTPAAGATDVEYTSLTEVSVVFDDDIPTDFTKNGIIVYRGGDQTDKYQTTNSIQIDPANSKKLNIPVSIYTANEIFTVLIPQANIAGLSAGVTWSFTTAKQVITPANPKPANNATDVHPASVVSFDFTPSVLLSELDDTKISISDGANTVPVTVSVTGGFGLSTVTLGHANFEYAKTYTVTVDADALVSASSKKLSGSYSWSFSTPAVAPTAIAPASYLPANGATGVEADAEIAVVFDGPIPVSGTDWSGISITQGTTAIT